MDTERYQALLGTLEQIKRRAEDVQGVLHCYPSDPNPADTQIIAEYLLKQIPRLCLTAHDQMVEVFRAEGVEA